ncbi:hypothetical protein OG529_04305 [Streptomyces longwoodensis]|uniref:hypothetical protein n=1 Tax=Streptomyces longwoodensis TaxID=68231 RepID=UPI003253FB31
MAFGRKNPETRALRETVAKLPGKVSEWTPEQRAAFAKQSDRAMREQNGVSADE